MSPNSFFDLTAKKIGIVRFWTFIVIQLLFSMAYVS